MRKANHILLVEDDESFGYILREYLEIHNFQVNLATDGEEGLQAFTKGAFELCILDVMLPTKDGFTLAKEIRQLDQDTPFIFLTAKALKVDKLKGFRLGCDDYVVKPIDEELFIARVQAIINRSAGRHQESLAAHKIGRYTFDFSNHSLELEGHVQRLTEK